MLAGVLVERVGEPDPFVVVAEDPSREVAEFVVGDGVDVEGAADCGEAVQASVGSGCPGQVRGEVAIVQLFSG